MSDLSMVRFFGQPILSVPVAMLDVETTGKDPWKDGVCQVAVIRFEQGKEVASFASFVDPGRPIPAESTEIHGITDEQVRGADPIEAVFQRAEVRDLLEGAHPAAYCNHFDRQFVPPDTFPDHRWPWIDPLVLIRYFDRYAKGSGRHKLLASCERHGITLTAAHSADADARAAGQLFYVLAPKLCSPEWTVGEYLTWQREQENVEWSRFMSWLSKQPPRESDSESA
jgi:DNA polymerase-3 subunit epsilon